MEKGEGRKGEGRKGEGMRKVEGMKKGEWTRVKG